MSQPEWIDSENFGLAVDATDYTQLYEGADTCVNPFTVAVRA